MSLTWASFPTVLQQSWSLVFTNMYGLHFLIMVSFVNQLLGTAAGLFYANNKIEERVGTNFNLSCVKPENFLQNCSADDMYFLKLDNLHRSLQPTIKLNESAIAYTFQNASAQKHNYRCMCGNHSVEDYSVTVGLPPFNVTDFVCRGQSFDYLQCNYTHPADMIFTNHTLTYDMRPVKCIHLRNSKMRCNITNICVKCNITFELISQNKFGKATNTFVIYTLDHMIPERPGSGLVVLNSTRDALCVRWEMGRGRNVYHDLVWDVQVLPAGHEAIRRDHWLPSEPYGMYVTLCVDHLPYIGYEYTLQVRSRVRSAKFADWSECMEHYFETKEERPARPPRLTTGSFYVYSSESQVRLYWQALTAETCNGKNVSYEISEYRVNSEPRNASSIIASKNSALLQNWQMDAKHEIYVRSRNRVNASVEASCLEIKPLRSEDFETRIPRHIRSAYNENNSSYTLFWHAPVQEERLLSYTVYWCTAKQRKLDGCADSMQFAKVNTSVFSYLYQASLGQLLNMAVSADYEHRNTGMHWHACSMDTSNDLEQMKPKIDKVTNTTLQVSWSTERVCPAILSGFSLTYCKSSNLTNDDCVTLPIHSDAKSYRLQHLEPYTKYTIRMLMYSGSRKSKYSEPLMQRTAEAAPTPPQLLAYTNVTNSSVQLSWQAPQQTNGVISGYRIMVNDNTYTELRGTNTTHLLSSLQAYTVYRVYLLAKTLHYSQPSNVISFQTKIGTPSVPVFDDLEITSPIVKLKWSRPLKPNGPLDYYEVRIIERTVNDTLVRQYTSYLRNVTSCELYRPECTGSNSYIYQVRAVNLALSGTSDVTVSDADEEHNFGANSHLKCSPKALEAYDATHGSGRPHPIGIPKLTSDWNTKMVQCAHQSEPLFFVMLSLALLTVFGILFYRKIKNMADIQCTLPAGLVLDYNALELKKPESERHQQAQEINMLLEQVQRNGSHDAIVPSSTLKQNQSSTHSVPIDATCQSPELENDNAEATTVATTVDSTTTTWQPVELASGYVLPPNVASAMSSHSPSVTCAPSGYVCVSDLTKPLRNKEVNFRQETTNGYLEMKQIKKLSNVWVIGNHRH